MSLEFSFLEGVKVTATLITGIFTGYKLYVTTKNEKTKTSNDQYIEINSAIRDNKGKSLDVHEKARIKTLLQINHGRNIHHDATEYIIDREVFPEYFQVYVRCQDHVEFSKDSGFYPKETLWPAYYYNPSKLRKFIINALGISLTFIASICLMLAIVIYTSSLPDKDQASIAFLAISFSSGYLVHEMGKVAGKLLGIEKLMKLHKARNPSDHHLKSPLSPEQLSLE